MTADDYIDKTISMGILYRRQRMEGGSTKITFTKLFNSPKADKRMKERSFSATDMNPAIAADIAFQAITNIK